MSLIHYWMFSEAAGSASADTVGGATATIVGAASGESVVLGGFGRGRDLQSVTSPPGGYSGFIDLAGMAEKELAEWSLVIRLQVNAAAMPVSNAIAAFFGESGWDHYIDVYTIYEGAGLAVYAQDLNNNVLDAVYAKPTGDLSDSVVTVILTSDGAASAMRVDGALASSDDSGPVSLLLSDYTRIGAYDNGQGSGPFTVYEVALFDHGLDATQINTIESGLPALFADPVALKQHAAATRRPQSLVVHTVRPEILSPPAGLIVPHQPAVLLQSPAGFVFADWSGLLNALEVQYYYACDITDGAETIRAPMSSWQATIKLEQASFVQAVYPSAAALAGQISAMNNPEFIIYKGVRLADGSTREEEICRAPVQTPSLSEGPTNTTLIIQGYTRFAGAPGAPRTLKNIRTQSNQGGIRTRCDIDLFLRPGQVAIARGKQFAVSYINYYANETDQYMDVGE